MHVQLVGNDVSHDKVARAGIAPEAHTVVECATRAVCTCFAARSHALVDVDVPGKQELASATPVSACGRSGPILEKQHATLFADGVSGA